MDSSPLNLVIGVIYYFSVGVLSLFGLFGVFVLVRYGRSVAASVAVGILFTFFYISILAASYGTYLDLVK